MPQAENHSDLAAVTNVRVPAYLNELAQAGDRGVLLERDQVVTAIEECRKWGIAIRISGDRAFLPADPDILVPWSIEKETVSIAWDRLLVEGFFRAGSTNDEVMARGRAGAPEGLLVYAEQQTAGRGRQLRHWHSPARAGLYFSLLLRPRTDPEHWPLLTHAASVALVRALEASSPSGSVGRPLAPEIKWPNDVLLSGRKTAGILLETISSGGAARAAVLGTGVNLTAAAIPPGCEQQATAVNVEAAASVPRRPLLVRFLEHFQRRYLLFEGAAYKEILEEWKQCSRMWMGAEVQITEPGRVRKAVTCGLSDSGALRIRTCDGQEEIILAADVSVQRV